MNVVTAPLIEEHELPAVEAVLACTLALMTGYSQALQAAAHPAQRLGMGAKIAASLALLAAHPQLSAGFRDVLTGLAQRWAAICDCTESAARDCQPTLAPGDATGLFRLAAPDRLQ